MSKNIRTLPGFAEIKCKAICQPGDDGEIKHHMNCYFYPESIAEICDGLRLLIEGEPAGYPDAILYAAWNKLEELEKRISLALRINAEPCIPGYIGCALRGVKLDEMPEHVAAILEDNNERE